LVPWARPPPLFRLKQKRRGSPAVFRSRRGSRSRGTLPPPLRGRPWHSWFGGPMVLLPQALHIMRHLWPSVPLYNSARLYQALKPVLRAEDSRIEGLMVGPNARAVTD